MKKYLIALSFIATTAFGVDHLIQSPTGNLILDAYTGNAIKTNKTLQCTAGTVSAPAIAFQTDPNTGIYSGGSDILKIAIGGSDQVIINSTGLGVGKTPTVALDVNGGINTSSAILAPTGTNAAPSHSFTTDTGSGMYSGGSNILKFVTSGTDRVTINASGQVGIGKSPSVALDVNGTIAGTHTGDGSGVTNLNMGNASSGTLAVARGGTNSSTALTNNRIMQSSGSAIVEAVAITANRALVSDANGIPTHSATTNTQIGYLSSLNGSVLSGTYPPTITFSAGTNTNLTIRTFGYSKVGNMVSVFGYFQFVTGDGTPGTIYITLPPGAGPSSAFSDVYQTWGAALWQCTYGSFPTSLGSIANFYSESGGFRVTIPRLSCGSGYYTATSVHFQYISN